MAYWYNIRTREVEAHDDPQRARGAELMGPYDTQGAAEAALETARDRTQEWDEEDRRWDDEGGDPPRPPPTP